MNKRIINNGNRRETINTIVAIFQLVLATIGAIYIYIENQDRKDARITRAWQMFHDASTRSKQLGEVGIGGIKTIGNLGQIQALDYLKRYVL